MRRLRWVIALALVATTSGCGFLGSGGEDDSAPTDAQPPSTISVRSSAFDDGAHIPATYACTDQGGTGVSPPLSWSGVPSSAHSLALVVEDPDAPGGTFVHWVVFNIDPGTTSVDEDSVPAGAKQTKNGAGRVGWTSPCPPSGTHHYRFTVYALRSPLTTPAGGDPQRVLTAIRGKTLARGTLTGLFAHS